MLKFACIGTGEFLKKGVTYLKEHGLTESPEPDLLICLAHPEILKRDTLDKYPLGCINFHPGLPKYRGRHPLQWMLIEGVKEIPVAVHWMDEGIDTGPILAESRIQVSRNETYASALEKVSNTVGPMLVTAMEKIAAGDIGQAQNPGYFDYYPRRTPEDSKIDFNWPAEKVHHFINALSDPMPNAFSHDRIFKRSYSGDFPGQIVAHCKDGRVVIATGNGVVLVDMQ